MRGSQESGIATASSTAAPKLIASPKAEASPGVPSKKMTLQSTSVRMKSAAMAILFTRPRFVMPMSIHRRMSAPMTRHQTQAPVSKMPFVARAPS